LIVFDASTLVGVALRPDSVPERALRHAVDLDVLALSPAVDDEIAGVLARPKFAARVSAARREAILAELRGAARWFFPATVVTACRDPKDDKYLELALAAGAQVIVSSDEDLLVLDPWRGVRVLRPAAYLAAVGGG